MADDILLKKFKRGKNSGKAASIIAANNRDFAELTSDVPLERPNAKKPSLPPFERKKVKGRMNLGAVSKAYLEREPSVDTVGVRNQQELASLLMGGLGGLSKKLVVKVGPGVISELKNLVKASGTAFLGTSNATDAADILNEIVPSREKTDPSVNKKTETQYRKATLDKYLPIPQKVVADNTALKKAGGKVSNKPLGVGAAKRGFGAVRSK
tara:strand:+ start:183 stop:815 length:633 start_codon:yes stop_codon:yes gene_type:complete